MIVGMKGAGQRAEGAAEFPARISGMKAGAESDESIERGALLARERAAWRSGSGSPPSLKLRRTSAARLDSRGLQPEQRPRRDARVPAPGGSRFSRTVTVHEVLENLSNRCRRHHSLTQPAGRNKA